MAASTVRYLVFDVESVADGKLIAQMRHPGQQISPEDAVACYRAELMEKYQSDFIPYTYQIPIAIAVAKVAEDFSLLDLVALDEPEYRPHVMVENFWRGWEAYRRPTLVSFNGHYFDLPLLELAAFRYGISLPGWFAAAARSFDQPRSRYNLQAHIDLCDLLTNFGTTRFTGGLNLAANLLGKPGKMEIQGHMVQDLYQQGRLSEIQDYCRCDVLDTYFVFLRTRVLVGQLSLEDEHRLVAQTKQWIQQQADRGLTAYQLYLKHWGDWQNPWINTDPRP
ncbi:MAG: 3'-5' exonuclease [Thermoguttaceae bacterium]|nr:3'-5' exonuclease [Thermoguttaceae bacterium]MDW8037635.1 3'-5' exonuclease [Thermoguttaceae bacterium]